MPRLCPSGRPVATATPGLRASAPRVRHRLRELAAQVRDLLTVRTEVGATMRSVPTTTVPSPAAMSTAARRRLLMGALPIGGLAVLAGSAAAVLLAPPSAHHHGSQGAVHNHAAGPSQGTLQPVGADQVRRVPAVGDVRLSVAAFEPARSSGTLRAAPPGTQ